MPTAVVGALLAGAVSGSIAAGALAFSWAAFATSLVLGGLSQALAKKPERSGGGSVSASGRLVTIRQPVAPWQIVAGQARVGGVVTFVNNYSGIDLVITLAGHVSQEIGDIYFDDEIVPLDGAYPNGGGAATGRYAGYVFIHKSLGDEAGQPFGTADSSGAGLVAESGGLWTDAHRQTGRTKIWVRLLPNADLFPNGVPNITAVVKGAKVYDPRTPATAYRNNAALWVSHYLTNGTYGLGATYADEIDAADLIAAANICDEAVALDGGGTEPRYTVNGAFVTSETPRRIIEKLLNGMAGKAVAAGEKWHIHAGAYEAPTLTFDEGDLAGPISVQSLVSRRENANGVKGVFTAPDNKWQPTDFPALASSTYLAEDGQRVWRDIDLTGFVTSGTQAQRLAKIELLRTRQGLTCVGQFKLTAWQAMTGRTVALDNTKFGWSAKPFDVVSSRFVVGDDATLNVELALRETASAVYAWSTSEEQAVDIAPNTNLPDPFAAAAPTGLAFDEGEYQLKGEGFLTWTASASMFIDAYQAECKAAAASAWTVLPRVPAARAYVTGLTPGAYNFRVKSINALGVSGAYSATLNVTIAPALVPVVSGLELFGQGLDTVFTGRDAKFAWRARSYQNTPEFGSETLGASEGRPDPYFKDYKVVVEDSGGTVRRTEFVPGEEFIYTYEKNFEDGAGTPVRAFRVKVWQRGQQNQLSAYPAQLEVSNPAPVISGVAVDTSVFDKFKFEYARPSDTDWSGIRIWASTSNGFTPGSGNMVYDGVDVSVVLRGVNVQALYYYRYALRDVFGFADTSAQNTVINSSIDPLATAQQAAIDAGLAPGLATDWTSSYSASAVELNVKTTATPTGWFTPILQFASIAFDYDNQANVFVQSRSTVTYNGPNSGVQVWVSLRSFDVVSRYTTGSIVSLADAGGGLTTCTGSGTNWLSSGLVNGDFIYFGIGTSLFQIYSVDSNTQLTLIGSLFNVSYSGSYIAFVGSTGTYRQNLFGQGLKSILNGATDIFTITGADDATPVATFSERIYVVIANSSGTNGNTTPAINNSLQVLQSVI